MLRGKKILVGITGSIAAYKSAVLIRGLIKAGAEVRALMTPSAHSFITPLTIATVSKNPVLTEFEKPSGGEWNNHVELGLWADALVIAPATGNTMAKMASGLCDNLLTAVYMSARCPVFIAPAMDLDMYRHPATQSNLEKLQSWGSHIIDAEYGELASGLTGTGRMAEPEHILDILSTTFKKKSPLTGKNVLITAGPTIEPVDPVRFISNHSSGKMGYALAVAFADAGASVTLISGPSALPLPRPQIQRINVRTASEMYESASELFDDCDIAVLAAAVSDYRPVQVASQKIKKETAHLQLELEKTVDIAASLGARKKHQFMVGFALETEQEEANARAKLEKKNFDLIVLNSLNDPGAGFGHDTNKITLLDKENNIRHFELKDKEAVAADILQEVEKRMK